MVVRQLFNSILSCTLKFFVLPMPQHMLLQPRPQRQPRGTRANRWPRVLVGAADAEEDVRRDKKPDRKLNCCQTSEDSPRRRRRCFILKSPNSTHLTFRTGTVLVPSAVQTIKPQFLVCAQAVKESFKENHHPSRRLEKGRAACRLSFS